MNSEKRREETSIESANEKEIEFGEERGLMFPFCVFALLRLER